MLMGRIPEPEDGGTPVPRSFEIALPFRSVGSGGIDATSVGYRIVRNAGVVLSAYEQVQSVEVDADSRFAGIRLWWAF